MYDAIDETAFIQAVAYLHAVDRETDEIDGIDMTEAIDNKTLRPEAAPHAGPFYVIAFAAGELWRIDDSKNPPAPVFEGSLPSLSSIEQEIDTELDWTRLTRRSRTTK